MKTLSIILFMFMVITLKSQEVQVIVSFTDGTPEKIYQVENEIGSIQEFAGEELRRYYRRENLNELQIYYDSEIVSVIYAGNPEQPFLIEYEDIFYESYRMDECIEWFYETFEYEK